MQRVSNLNKQELQPNKHKVKPICFQEILSSMIDGWPVTPNKQTENPKKRK